VREKELMIMFRKIAISAVSALVIGAGTAYAAGGVAHVTDVPFSFEGPFGTFDEHQLQRGLQVYTEVCSACHGMKFVPLRTLGDEGGPNLPEDQVRAYAAQFDIFDAELDDTRPRKPTDMFPMSGLENAPDLSLMAKARAGFHGPYGLGINQLFKGIGGSEYIYSVISHYEDNPECAPDGVDGFYYNTAFAAGSVPDSCKDEHGVSTLTGTWIAMPPPLSDDQVEYADGTDASVHQMSEDVSAFLMWAAEPKMMARKTVGLTAVIFLTILSVLLYLTNKKVWLAVKGPKKKHA
jgi:ubiquinol-cytochrome c reductase cytochrome c1 subunit